MTIAVLVLFFLLFFAQTAIANVRNEVSVKNSGGSSTVKIDNKVSSDNDTTSYTSESSTSTNVEIHQSGEGTSKVNINGKEWKLDGPGDISVSETSKPGSTSSPTSSPTASPTSTSSVTPESSEDEEANSAIEHIIKVLEKILDNLRHLI